MENYTHDHLELNIPSHFQKQETLSTPSTQASDKSQLKHVRHFLPEDAPSLTVVSLTKKQENAISKPRASNGDQGRRCIKKMTSKFLNHSNFVRAKTKKENIILKEDLDERIQQSQARRRSKKSEKKFYPIEYLQIKSLDLNEQLITLKSQRRRSVVKSQRNLLNQSKKELFQGPAIKTLDDFQLEKDKKKIYSSSQVAENDPSKQIQKKLQSQLKLKDSKQGKGFYEKLKERLSLQIKEIQQKQQLDLTSIVVSSVKMKDYPSQEFNNDFRTSLTERSRPRTALTRVGLEAARNGSTVKKKRPQSSSAKVLEKRQIAYMNSKMQEDKEQELRNYSNIYTSRSACRKKQNASFNPDISVIFKHVNQMHKRKNWSASKGELEKEKLKEKMLKILIDCHSETIKNSNLNEGVEVFSRYCNKMSKNLSKTSRMIENVQKTVTIEEEQQYF